MKVIKKGRPQKGWAKQITCTGKGHGRGGCGAVLMVEEGDLFRGERMVMGRDHEEWVYFVCSECGVLSDVNGYPGDPSKLPQRDASTKTGLMGDVAKVRTLKRTKEEIDLQHSLCGCGKSGCYMCTED